MLWWNCFWNCLLLEAVRYFRELKKIQFSECLASINKCCLEVNENDVIILKIIIHQLMFLNVWMSIWKSRRVPLCVYCLPGDDIVGKRQKWRLDCCWPVDTVTQWHSDRHPLALHYRPHGRATGAERLSHTGNCGCLTDCRVPEGHKRKNEMLLYLSIYPSIMCFVFFLQVFFLFVFIRYNIVANIVLIT